MALTQGSSSSLTPPAQAQLEACVSFPPLFDARVSLPCRQQRGGAERQLETQSHHAQSALGLPQVGGETTNAKPNCDLLGPLNNWGKKNKKQWGTPPVLWGCTVCFPVERYHKKKKKHNCVLSPARCRPEAPLRSCCPRLPTRENWTRGTRGAKRSFFRKTCLAASCLIIRASRRSMQNSMETSLVSAGDTSFFNGSW